MIDIYLGEGLLVSRTKFACLVEMKLASKVIADIHTQEIQPGLHQLPGWSLRCFVVAPVGTVSPVLVHAHNRFLSWLRLSGGVHVITVALFALVHATFVVE